MVSIPGEEQTNELRSGITAAFDKSLNEVLSLFPSIRYWITNRVNPSLLVGILKGSFGTPGIVSAVSVEKDEDNQIRLSIAARKMLQGKTILYDFQQTTNSPVNLRTVAAKKTYYLVAAGTTMYSTVTNIYGTVYIGTTARTFLSVLSAITPTYATAHATSDHITFPHPLPIAAGEIIRTSTNNAAGQITSWIIGYEE